MIEVFAREAPQLARHGWAVFPLAPVSKEPLSGSRGHLDATADADLVQSWVKRVPTANVGVRPGPNQCVLDVDDPAQFERWRRDHGLTDLPPTRTVRTRSGSHRYFALPGQVRLSGGVAGVFDTKQHSGYVVGPGSVHPTGKLYRLAVEGPVATLPADWLQALQPVRAEPKPNPFAAGLPDANPAYKLVASLGLYRTGRRTAFRTRVAVAYARYLAHPRLLADLEAEALRVGVPGGRDTTSEILAWAEATLTPNWNPDPRDPLPPEFLS